MSKLSEYLRAKSEWGCGSINQEEFLQIEQAKTALRLLPLHDAATREQAQREQMEAQRENECAADLFTDTCQILDVVKEEWADEWSAWDAKVRERISNWLTRHYKLRTAYAKARPVKAEAESVKGEGEGKP